MYHILGNKRPDLNIADCWIHAKRRFSNLVKAVGTENVNGTTSAQVVEKTSNIFHEDKKLKNLSAKKRMEKRQQVVKPLVYDFFEWLKEISPSFPSSNHTAEAINYA